MTDPIEQALREIKARVEARQEIARILSGGEHE